MGSGTLLPDDRHRSAGHLLEWEKGRLLLDCGSGVLHGLARDEREWQRISHLALSHFHTDHMGDLAPLLWAWKHGATGRVPRRRTLLGPPGLNRVMKGLAEAHGGFVWAPGGPLDVVELPREGRWEDSTVGLVLHTHAVPHTDESIAFRVEVGGRVVGYTGDTGPDSRLGTFFRGADVLVAECAVPDESEVKIHLSPSSLAAMVHEASPRHLVVTHLYPGVARESLADFLRAQGIEAEIRVADDGLRVSL